MIAHHVLREGERLASSSIAEIAEACDTSKATTVRFFKALGYDGFRTFKQDLIRHYVEPAQEPAQDGGATADTEESMLAHIARSVGATRIDAASLERAVSLIAGSSLVVWFGIGDSYFLAQSADHRCMINGMNSRALQTAADVHLLCKQVKPGDVLVCLSRSGRWEEVVKAVRVAKASSEIKIVAVTGNPGSPLVCMADVALISSPIDLYVEANRTTMQATQMAVVDTLLAGVLRQLYPGIRTSGIVGEASGDPHADNALDAFPKAL